MFQAKRRRVGSAVETARHRVSPTTTTTTATTTATTTTTTTNNNSNKNNIYSK